MHRGIRQGCPISAILYHFIAEILSIKVKENKNIKGFQTYYMEKEVKNIQHADDMTLILKNLESLNRALETIIIFCNYCVSKTECILLGPLKNCYTNINDIKVTNKTVKCLGIYIGHDEIECFNQNWMKVYQDIETLFES